MAVLPYGSPPATKPIPTTRSGGGYISVVANEHTIIQGSSSFGIFMPSAPVNGTINTITNYSTASSTMIPSGSDTMVNQGVTGNIGVVPYATFTLMYYNGTWYVTDSSVNSMPVLNVVSFGADASGTFDSASAIQSAINALGTIGGTVYIPPGTFKINSTITLGDGSQIGGTVTSVSGTFGSGTGVINMNSGSIVSFNGGSYPTGGGTISCYTASLTSFLVTYTSYNNSTKVFSGCTASSTPSAGQAISYGVSSTTHNITLKGSGVPGQSYSGFSVFSQIGTKLNWGGSAGGTMIALNGMMSGFEISGLYLNCGASAAVGVQITAGQSGKMDGVFVERATSKGFYFTGVTGFPDPVSGTLTTIGTTMGCTFRNLGGQMGSTDASSVFYLDGDPLVNGVGSANTTYCTFENLYLSMPDPGSTKTNNAIYLHFCDNIVIRNVTIICPTPPAGTCYAVTYDYTNTTNCPMDCLVDSISPNGSTGAKFRNVGTPVTTNPNRLVNIRGSVAYPQLANLSVNNQYNAIVNAPGGTPSINTNNTDIATFTGVNANITSMTTNLTGTPYDGQKLIIRITGTSTFNITAWGSSFESGATATLPTTAAITTTMTSLAFVYNSVSTKWRLMAIA